MFKRETPFLLCEAVCEAVRLSLPDALANDAYFFFDYEGASAVARADSAVVQSLVDRVVRYSLRALSSGVIFFRVLVAQERDARCCVTIRASANRSEARSVASQVVFRDDQPLIDTDLVIAQRLCQSLHGDVRALDDGMISIVEAQFEVPVLLPVEQPQVTAAGAAAWLISSPPLAMEMLARRLARLGWEVTSFATTAEAEAELLHLSKTVPSLVIASAHRGVITSGFQSLRARLPGGHFVLLALQNAPIEDAMQEGADLVALPISPRRLLHYTEQAYRQQQTLATDSIEPSDAASGELILVVDDNALNRTLGEEILESLGYRVASVDSGESAIEYCLCDAPTLVLMDLEMPGIGGVAAATSLKLLQRNGQLKPFPIVSFSARGPQPTSGADPFDGALSKPIDIAALRINIARWLADAASAST